MRKLTLPGILLLVVALTAQSPPPVRPALPPPGRYTLLAPPSQLTIRLWKTGWLSALGENHIIIARQMRGQASLGASSSDAAAGARPARPSGTAAQGRLGQAAPPARQRDARRSRAGARANQWTGDVRLAAAALRVADPRSSAHDRAEVQATMDGPSQLDIARFPQITWRLAALSLAPDPKGDAGEIVLHGEFTLHGVTRPETWRTRWDQQGRRIHMWGHALLRLTDFGIHPIHRGLGAVRVKNQFELNWDIYWRRDP